MISVIMCTYNENVKLIEDSVESILKQSYADFEYIIVLDNPENIKIRNILQKYEKNDYRIKLIYNKKNLGLTVSLNKALNLASGEYIARIDADDVAEQNRFEKQLKYIEEQNLDLIGSQMRRISENGEIVNVCTNKSFPHQCIENLLDYDNCVPHPSWFVKKKVYDVLSGYRDIIACEDYDFLLRAKKHGFKIGIADSILMNYRISLNGISRTNSLRQVLSSNYLQKNFYRIDEVTQDEIEKNALKYNTKENAENYENSLRKMKIILDKVKNGERWQIIKLFTLLFESKFIYINYKKIFKMYKVKKKYYM